MTMPTRHHVRLSEFNFGFFPMVNDQSRLATPLLRRSARHGSVRAVPWAKLWTPDAALALGLVTAAPDDIDWADEIRIGRGRACGHVA
jgi:benzoyl-CoA-dihydrodiol lyase